MKKQLTIILMVGSLILVGLNAHAHPKGPKALIDALNLTAEQQQEFERLHAESKPNKKFIHEQRKALHEKRNSLLENYSEEKAQELAEEIAQQAKNRALQRFSHMHQVMLILDDEQKATFLQLMDKKKKGKHSHRDHH
ncbi:hypothetical protein HF888_13210 [Bermanella marisrubri]|uniref:Zinc resistance-associated protein n=1 Tax=Bermanella marisrubri TaxID=207949 RepID=Q1MY93_9GAMM|nr:Spy/CpxP family protein refolding chaperone [Bermanella marisrubri]EAT10974.1 hypothetical protein RED65_03125 [Oceanobacter sp. RED65] [Bermanella marisrubri]QIZ85121.1 hypothetical protein HF888_13210 [Bermanella marisrubri]